VICRRATEVVTQSLDAPLGLRARVGLGVHTLFCSPCRRFQRQMARLHAVFKANADRPEGATDGGLSDAARARIAAALSRADEPR
jgi:hypothetical protein